MRFLLVALCLSALAIAARAQCNSNADCFNSGTCAGGVCKCPGSTTSNGITTTYSGSQCRDMKSWWLTNATNTEACSYDCAHEGEKTPSSNICKCKTFFDGNVTTVYSGRCCENYQWSYQWSWSSSSGSGGQTPQTYSNATITQTSCTSDAYCSGHGVCKNGGCVCNTPTKTGNRTIEYYGPTCSSWMAWWYWYDSYSSSYSYMEVKGAGEAQSTLGYTWAADGVGMAVSKQEWYCWCKNTTLPVAEQATANCIASCNASLTCNGHGTCNADHSCTCTGNFAGRWCDQCKPGWGNSKTSAGNLCDVCMPSYYPAGTCTTFCIDDKHCGGKGKCDTKTGKCVCNPGFKGNYCEQCKENEGFYDSTTKTCNYCTGDATCNGKGVCSSGGACACATGFSGDRCEKCNITDPKQPWPKCAGAVAGAAAKGGAAVSDECEGPNLALPIILSILGTLIVMLIAFAVYRMWAAKQAGAGGAGTAKSSNWSEFEKDSSTAYSQL